MIRISILIFTVLVSVRCLAQEPPVYHDLEVFFQKWRGFEVPPDVDGVPDYRAETFANRQVEFAALVSELDHFSIESWPVAHQIDWYLVKAEMNGYDFNRRILKPWARDPAYYKTLWISQSDTPAHEGPTHHAVCELWTYSFPLTEEEEGRLTQELATISSINEQARQNLVGNAKDLWIAGIRDIRRQETELKILLSRVKDNSEMLQETIKSAIVSTAQFVHWLEEEAKTKSGPSGIGKEDYTWYLQNVHLVPLTWEDEVMILKRELARAWSSLKLEEHRNRHLPELKSAQTRQDFKDLTDRSATSLMNFLEENEIITVKDYFDPALRAQLGSFMEEERRNFFVIGMHIDPRPLYSHFYHWFELARMEREPHPSKLRRGPLLYNIFDSRNEGMATAVEEMYMQAGLYDDDPRVREIVYIMIAQRAARGLGSLYAHANEMTMEEAGKIHSEYTPRGWMKTEKELLLFEQHLYLRQPGYGTSYITGKHLLEETMAEYARLKELNQEPFAIRDYFDGLNKIGNIPVSLARWELTGTKERLLNALNE